MVTEERRAELWERAERIRMGFDAVRLTIMGRECVVEVMEVSNATPALVGQIPLEILDLVVNPMAGTLTGNPAHGGEHVLELL